MKKSNEITPEPARTHTIPPTLRKTLQIAAAALFWLAVWQLVASAVDREVLIASPYAVFTRLCSLASTGKYWAALFSSLLRVFGGYLVGILCGLLLAALSALSRFCETLVTPLITAIKATPVASFIIIALVWFKTPFIPVITSALMVAPVIYGAALTAVRSVDVKLIEAARVFAFSPLKTLRRVIIPSIMPAVSGAAVTSLGLSWKAGIAAEVLCTPRGSLGRYLYESKIYLETPDLFAWTLTIITASLLLEFIIKRTLGGRGSGK